MAKNNATLSLSTRAPLELVVYGREGCHLCEDMIAKLREWQARQTFSFEVIDVDSDPSLRLRYGELVPVLMAGDEEICHYHLDPIAFEKLFASA